ncbi:hypothetical protein EJB05_31610, partial [Eragrostis curvula]
MDRTEASDIRQPPLAPSPLPARSAGIMALIQAQVLFAPHNHRLPDRLRPLPTLILTYHAPAGFHCPPLVRHHRGEWRLRRRSARRTSRKILRCPATSLCQINSSSLIGNRENSEMKYECPIRSELLLQSKASQAVMNSNNGSRIVSLSTCTKIGAISFAVGVVVRFTLKRRLCPWAARLLKRIKDDD